MDFPALPSQLRIALVPAATINSASSRLRCFGLGRELAILGYMVDVGVDLAKLPHVLLVQKVINPAVLAQAQRVHAHGGVVLYDIDDYGPEALGSLKADETTFNLFMRLVSVVVVDTRTRLEVLRREPGFSQIAEMWLVPDPIDYIEASTRGAAKPPKEVDKKLRACWFGNAPNIVPALPFLQALADSARVASVNVMLNAHYVDYFHANYPQFSTSAWALNSFPGLLQTMDFCVLIHSATIEGVQKSNNKMLAALALGVVPFVSRTPAYLETALQMGVSELVIDSPQDVLARIQPEQFKRIVQKMNSDHCSDELQKYYPAVSARLFSEKLLAYLGAKTKIQALNT